jgi:gas vesicle protein
MARHEFDDGEYDEYDPRGRRDPYVVVERRDAGGVTPFLIGLALGAGAALLLAPRSGAATRRDIKRRARRMRRAAERAASGVTGAVADTFHDARRRVEEQLDSAREAVGHKRDQVHRAMDAGRTAAHEARGELERHLAETKAAYRAGASVARARRTPAAADEPSQD